MVAAVLDLALVGGPRRLRHHGTGWDAGLKPYRDLIGNNFTGSIYLFWMVGKLCGWGNSLAYNAFDALLLGGFGAAVVT